MLNKLQRLVAIEEKRYKNKGLINTAIGFGLLFGITWASLTVGRAYWPEKIEDKASFILIGGFFCHFTFQVVSFLIFLPGYMGWSSYYAKHLINKKSSRPWERKNWPEMLNRNIKNLILNQLVVYPLSIYISNLRGIRVRFDNFPQFGQFFSQIFIVYFIEDFFFYWGHRMFHLPYFYSMHKVHHEFDTLYTWVTEYFHPLDFVIANLLPSAMGFVILGSRAHCFTFFFWICWKVFLSSEAHSGYEFQWTPARVVPFVTGPSYHDHHHSHNAGNFAGSCYLWDLMLDTNVPYMNDFLKN